jgi:hypothetical protein
MGNTASYNDQDQSAYNLACLRQVAERMGPLREEVVFLGGTILPLLTTRPTGLSIRKSKDVDMLADFPSKDKIYAFEDGLWERGFKKKSTGVICRWVLEDIRIDVLPADPDVLGFNNQWCREAMSRPLRIDLEKNLTVHIIGPSCFLGAKFNAFYRRGEGDYAGSYDLYDMLVLLAGRPGVDQEILESASPALQRFLSRELKKFWKHSNGLKDFSFKIVPENGNHARLLDTVAACMKKIIFN